MAHALSNEEDNAGRGGAVNDNAVRCAVAGEMVHTATLLHDDVADQANMRRGAASVRSLYSPSASVLLGDFWLSRAVSVVVGIKNFDIFKKFASAIEELAEGEMLEIQKADDLSTTYEDYIRIIRHKTASLFESTISSAALAVGAPSESVDAADRYALHLGLAFQIRDDIFDYSPDLDTGKQPGSDLLEGKITLPLLGAFSVSTESEIGRIKALVKSLDHSKEPTDAHTIADINSFITEKGGIEYSNRILSEEGKKAVDALSPLPDSRYKKLLAGLAEYVGSRDI